MEVCKVGKGIVSFVQNKIAKGATAVSQNYGAEMAGVVGKAASKAPNYAAVRVNGLIVYMPVEQAQKTKGAEILKSGLSSVDDILKAMQTHCNII